MDILIHSDGSAELYHYGVLGMKWGVRRYRNSDGTLTASGGRRDMRKTQKNINKYEKRAAAAYGRAVSAKDFQDSYNDKYKKSCFKR